LRNQDRQKNFAAYPNIFYPELYILQGGYEAYYKAYPVSPPHTCSAPLAGQDG